MYLVLSCRVNCNLVLTDPQGTFTSPCYPSDYPQSQTCKWTLQAPTGFIVQITFLDFELEEVHGCIYDRVLVNTGTNEVKFCGLTANGLTLNSSGNVMEVSFNSDFSVQKKGFSVSYRQVAVALRNQKVTLTRDAKDVVKVSSSVNIPTLNDFTICFEAAVHWDDNQNTENIFSYVDDSSNVILAFGKTVNGMALTIDGTICLLNAALGVSDITSSLRQFCLTWSKNTGHIGVYFGGNYRTEMCTDSRSQNLRRGSIFHLGRPGTTQDSQVQSFSGVVYNFRLWNSEMSFSSLSALTCDDVGNLIDWDNDFWDIPDSYAQTDSSLSCSTSLPTLTSQMTTCASPGLGCPATLTTIPSIATTNTISTNAATHEDIFYRIFLVVNNGQASLTDTDVERAITQWLNQTFQNWIYTVYVDNIRLVIVLLISRVFTCYALLVYKNTTNTKLAESDIEGKLNAVSIGSGLVMERVTVESIENCPSEDNPFHYKWPETRPTITQYVPCFPYKERNASRTCMISHQNYTSFWNQPDLSNCTDIKDIEVSEENAAEVAVQLADITNNELSTEEVSQVVTKVKELVNVARINATLASTVVTIISNVMTSSESAQMNASKTALKAVDELVQKIEFEGPSLAITSKNLAVGISSLNSSRFNGTSFSAFLPPNTTDPQIDFDSESQNPLAMVVLPPTLLRNLSSTDTGTASRINFMFFSKTGLFPDRQSNGLSLSSYVVASSVGNLSISNLLDPIQIEIAHLQNQSAPRRHCVFWDFTIKNGAGGWNSEGCEVSPKSDSYKTICLCNHLTHFGILMDISGAAAQIDEKNTRVLTFITYIGCGISAIFSAATLLTYIAFEKLRRDYPSKILMNLSTSLLFLNMVFLLDGWLASYDMEGLCVAVAVFLHYFLLTSFTWMGLESIHMYIALVKVFNTYIRRYILKFCIVGWGVPAAIIGIVVAVDRNSYGKEYYGKGGNGQGSSEFCWIKSLVVFYVTCVGYFSIIFLMNVAMFIVVMMQICGRNGKRSNRTLKEEILRNLRSVVSLTFLLGMTWGFAFFAWGPVNLAFMYLFSIFNSLQGLFIFIFHCALKENVQKQWRRYLCCGKLRLADNSDWSKTATNNTKKVSSDNLGKSLSSSSFGSSTANWTSKAKATLNPFAKRNSNAGKSFSSQASPKCSSSDGEPSSSIIPVHQVLDKVKGYCSVRSDNFYKNIIMSDSFSHSTKF
ncbi:adhesion G-protein coupled receptor G6 [Chanos chanos]|uniref:Adhesion G-protein coupled receptor G6 n=1 Tax=Chanos chanos TaxID=29144 RepID=A0A6J2V8B6_CHACN|nr:adhesion G-protein coupled receptor G6 [Chanos chanos]